MNSYKQARGATISIAGLHLDPVGRKFWHDGKEIDLVGRECSLLVLFMRHPNQILSSIVIAEYLWGYAEFDPQTVDLYVNSLWKKVDIVPGKKKFFVVRGVGYLLKLEI